ncbi:MAG: hypothetical protein LBD86_03460 [Spirochaetaceae bacterium]|nr:hypothetical protein [Spirochaetaceae bacterium]
MLLPVCGCYGKAAPPEPLPIRREEPRPAAIVRTGAVPLWTEFSGGRIRPVSSPEEAALKPFEPWPLAEYATDIVQWGEYLVIAVNRHGFCLVKEANNGFLELFYLPETEFTPSYTILKVFTFRNKPAFLLYRNDFFVKSGIPPPESKVFTVNDDISGLEAVEIPAFFGFSGVKGWDIEDLFTGTDGAWYFKAIRKDGDPDKISYMRTGNLYSGGEEIMFAAYMRAARTAAEGRQDGADLPAWLPPLPENFVYSSYLPIGGAGVAAWEERESWNTGAAGLLFLRLDSGSVPPP